MKDFYFDHDFDLPSDDEVIGLIRTVPMHFANATARVPSTTTEDYRIQRPLAATATTYYPGCMMALDSSGNAVHCDNTAGIKFDGINADSVPKTVNSGDSAGDQSITVARAFRFQMAIASASAGDEGKALYAADDQTVSYSQTNNIFVGYVDQVITSTLVSVKPAYLDSHLDGIGYHGSGSGGTVTQITSATTGVTLNKLSGQITTVTENIAAGGNVQFTVTNSQVAAIDTVIVNVASGSTGGVTDARVTAVAAGSFKIELYNSHASVAETGTLVINFNVIKGSSS